jgi:hypothetical protein
MYVFYVVISMFTKGKLELKSTSTSLTTPVSNPNPWKALYIHH